MIRTALRTLLILLAGALVLALAGVAALRVGAANWAVNQALAVVNPFPGVTLRTAKSRGNLFGWVELRDVRLSQDSAYVPLSVELLRVRYDFGSLLAGNIVVHEIHLENPRVTVRQRPDSSWDLPQTPHRKSDSSLSRRRTISIGRLSVAGGAFLLRFGGTSPDSIAGTLDGEGSLDANGLRLTRMAVHSGSSMLTGSGTIHLPLAAGLDVNLVARPLGFRDLRFLSSRLNRAPEVDLTLHAAGTTDRLEFVLDAGFPDGGSAGARGVVTPTKTGPVEYKVRGHLRGVDPALFISAKDLPRQIDGSVILELAGASLDRLGGRADVELYASPQGSRKRRRAVARALFDEGRGRIDLETHLGFGSVGVRGWIMPFDSVPSYNLIARVRSRGQASAPWLQRLLGNVERRGTVTLVGRGLDPKKADLRALATIDPGPGSAGLLDSGSVDVRFRQGRGLLRAAATVGGGTVALSGAAILSPELVLRIDRGSVHRVDVSGLIGDSAISSLDATFSLQSRGTSARGASARAEILNVLASYGSHTLQDGRFRLSLEDGMVQVAGKGRLDGGDVVADVIAHPFLGKPRLTLRNLSFRRLDLAAVLPTTGIRGNVSGTMRARARGRQLRDLELSSTLSLDPSQIGEHPLDRARIQADLIRGRLTFRATANAPAGQINLAGFARPFGTVPSYAIEHAEFDEIDLGRILSSPRLHTRLAGSIRVEGSGLKPEGAVANGVLTLRSSTVNATTIEAGRLEARLTRGKLDLSALLEAPGDSLGLIGIAYPFEGQPRFSLTGAGSIDSVAELLGRVMPHARAAGTILIDGTWGPPETMSLTGTASAAGRIGGVELDSVATSFELSGGVLTVDSLALRSNVGVADGSGVLGLFAPAARSSSLRVVGWLADVEPLGPILGVPRLGLDSGGFTASVRGPRDSLRVEVEAQGENLQTGSRRIGALHATLSAILAADRSVLAADAALHAERLVMGRTTVREIRVQGTKHGAAMLVRAQSVVDPERSGRLVARLYPDSSHFRLDTLQIDVPGDRWSLSQPVAVAYGDRTHIDDFSLTSGGRRIAIDGVVDRRGEQQLKVTIDSLRLGRFADLLGAREIDGEINGIFQLGGPAAAPHAQGNLDLALRARDEDVGRARGHMDWTATGLLLDLGFRQSKGDSLVLRGRIPLALSLEAEDTAGVVSRIPGGGLALDAVTNRFRLDGLEPLFDPETVRKIRGRLNMKAHVAGTLETPQLSGDITLTEAAVRIPRLGARYDKGEVRLSLRGQEVRVMKAQLESGGGRFETEGTIQLPGFPETTLDLQSTFSSFQVAASHDFRSSLSGTLKLTGATSAPVLSGSLQVRNSDVYLQAKNLQHAAEAVELTSEDLRTLERRFGYAAVRGSVTEQKPLAPWDLGLKVKLAENNWLRRRSDPVMAVELGGQLDIRKAPREDIKVFGKIQPLPGRSFVQMMGRRFELREGSVNLSGPLEETAIALKAEYRAASPSGAPPVLITTAVRSDTGKLVVSMSSIPAMRSEDIMSYLTTGRPASTDPTLQSDEQDALSTGASLAVGAALGTVAGGAGQTIGLDVVQVLQDREGGQTLVAGKYVSPPLYLGFRQPIVAATSKSKSDDEADLVEFEVEYATLRQFLLNLQGGGSELRVFLRLRR